MSRDVSQNEAIFSPHWAFANRPPCGTDDRMNHKQPKQNADSIPDKNYRGHRARSGNQTLRSWTVGGLPLINRVLQRIDLEALLEKHLPKDDPRLKIPTRRGLLLLVKNILLSREPIYAPRRMGRIVCARPVGFAAGRIEADQRRSHRTLSRSTVRRADRRLGAGRRATCDHRVRPATR